MLLGDVVVSDLTSIELLNLWDRVSAELRRRQVVGDNQDSYSTASFEPVDGKSLILRSLCHHVLSLPLGLAAIPAVGAVRRALGRRDIPITRAASTGIDDKEEMG